MGRLWWTSPLVTPGEHPEGRVWEDCGGLAPWLHQGNTQRVGVGVWEDCGGLAPWLHQGNTQRVEVWEDCGGLAPWLHQGNTQRVGVWEDCGGLATCQGESLDN